MHLSKNFREKKHLFICSTLLIAFAVLLFKGNAANAGNMLQTDIEDYGDLPINSSGQYFFPIAAHIIAGPKLGALIDAEGFVQPDINALGDDNNGQDDEDGVTFVTPLMAGEVAVVRIIVSAPGYLSGWIDFDGNSVLDSIDQGVFLNGTSVPDVNKLHLPNAGVHNIGFTVPANGNGTSMYSRWRITAAADDLPTNGFPAGTGGKAVNGEVEDYVLMSLGSNVFGDDGCGAGMPNDGLRTGCEAGIGGVTLELLQSDCSTPVTTLGSPITAVTDANGDYLFTGLTPGDYCVRVSASNFQSGGVLEGSFSSDGYANPENNVDNDDNGQGGQGSNPAADGVISGPINLALGQEPGVSGDGNEENSNMTVDFGFLNGSKVCIGDIIWSDQDGDTINFGEPGIANVNVLLYAAGSTAGDGSELASTSTDSNGLYHFCGLNPGSYFVAVDLSSPALNIYTGTSVGGNHNPDAQGDDNTIFGDDCTNGPDGYVITQPVNATVNGQTTLDDRDVAGYPDASSYMTVDCGFTPPGATAVSLQSSAVANLADDNAAIYLSFVALALATIWLLNERRTKNEIA